MDHDNIEVMDLQNGTFPEDVQALISTAASQGDLFSVTGVRAFGGQILKAGVVTFQPGSKLILNNDDQPWIAIVTNQLQFVDTSKDATIKLSIDWQPKEYTSPPQPAAAPKGPKAGITQDGVPGIPGTPGQDGMQGDAAPKTPRLYIVCGGVADKQSQPIPAALKLSVIANGYSGGHGGNGGTGGNGGGGADGGDGEMGSFIEGCKHSASNGGAGSVGGQGGAGGRGGNAGSGADIVLVGTKDAWVALSYAAFETHPGMAGQGGYAGPSGISGPGGARGAHPGSCRGGNPGVTPSTPPTPHVQAPNGSDGRAGIITKVVDNDIARFF